MTKLLTTPIPPAPPQYNPQREANVVRILNLALSRVNYVPQSQHIAHIAQNWIGL